MSVLFRFIAVAIGVLALSVGAHAGCDITGVQSVSPSTLNVGAYTATSIPPPTTLAVTLTVMKTGNGNGNCQGGFALFRAAAPAQMTRQPPGSVALPYGVTFQSAPILYFAGGTPTIARLPNFHAPSGNTTGSVTFMLTITPQTPVGVPAAGTYLDELMLRVYNRQNGGFDFVGALPLTISAQAIQSCYVTNPSSLGLNFTTDILSGVPAGAVQSTSFSVNCTGPSRLQLSGSALVMPLPSSPSGAFDNFINYRAVASFGGTSATLTTSGTAPVTVTSPSASTLVGTNLPVNLNINLIPNRPLIGGSSYSSVLRVTVDPAL